MRAPDAERRPGDHPAVEPAERLADQRSPNSLTKRVPQGCSQCNDFDEALPPATTSRTKRKPAAAWCSWFIHCEAVHVPADSLNGQAITARLAELAPVDLRTDQRRRATLRRLIRPILDRGANIDTATVRADKKYHNGKWSGTCSAPLAMFHDRICGKEFWGRKGQKFCSDACAARARRRSEQTGGPDPQGGDISGDIDSHLPGVPQPIIDVTAPLFVEVSS